MSASALVARRYPVLLAFGASYSVGAQLANVSSVLPYLLAEKGIFWAASLLFPVFSIGFVAGNMLSPLVVVRSRRRQYVIIAVAAVTIATLTSSVAVAALRDVSVALSFLSASLVIGAAMGMANNAYAEIISRMLPTTRRNQLLLNQEAVGAVLTVLATLMILPLLARRAADDGHVDVLWLGAAAMLAATVAAVLVGSTKSVFAQATSRDRRNLPRGHHGGANPSLVPGLPGDADLVRADRPGHDAFQPARRR